MATIDDEMKSRFQSDQHRAVANVMFTGSWIRNLFVDFIKPYGISPQQFNILRILRGAGDWMNMQDIKSRMVEKSPNTTRLCDKLLDKGLILRNRSEADRRVVFLKISEKGLELLADIDKVEPTQVEKFWENLTVEEANTLSDLLDKLRG